MKTLYLLRHAKSSWSDANLADFDRPLNNRGELAAPFMGRLIKARNFVPDVVYSSPAERARQTATAVKKAGEMAADLVFDERIYEASPRRLSEVVTGINDVFASAMIVGHNPGIEGFVRYLTASIEPMPTAALAVIELSVGRWKDVDEVCGRLVTVIRPRDEGC
jgi:phosphohistidine phosphatase